MYKNEQKINVKNPTYYQITCMPGTKFPPDTLEIFKYLEYILKILPL